MRSAETFLGDVAARLDLPTGRRVAVLRELRADFDDLVATLVAEGCTPEAARSRALALLVPTASDVVALTELHRPAYARLAGRLPSRYARAMELTGIGGMAFLATLAPFFALAGMAGLPPWAGTALGGVAGIVVAHLAWHAFRILIREDADAAGLVRAGAVQGGLIGLALAVGALATVIEAYVVAGSWATRVDIVGLASSLATCAETAALALSIGMLGLFGAAALSQAYLSTRDVEEELGRLLAAVPPETGDDRS